MNVLPLILVLSTAAGEATEGERIRSHLELVEKLLRAQPAPTAGLESQRQRNLDTLHRYWEHGEFPHNTTLPGARSPIFIDDRGVACAAAAVIIGSGHEALARRISATRNDWYLDEMVGDEELEAWVATSGLRFGELRLIQPTYRYHPSYPDDPLLEAAHLGDLASIRARVGSSMTRSVATSILRAAARSAMSALDSANLVTRSLSTPYVGDGMAVMAFAIEHGADVNDANQGRSSILFETRSPTARTLLTKHGATLTAAERVVDALRRQACPELPSLLADPSLDFTAQDAMVGALRPEALGECAAVVRAAQNPTGGDVNALLPAARNDPDRFVGLLRRGVGITTIDALEATIALWRDAKKQSKSAQVDSLGRALRIHPPAALMRVNCEPHLIKAVANKDTEAIDLYRSFGVNVQPCDDTRVVPFLSAIQPPAKLSSQQRAQVAIWLRAGAIATDARALAYAVDQGDDELAEMLLTSGATIKDDPATCPVLAVAVAQDNVKLAKVLLTHGANKALRFTSTPRCPGKATGGRITLSDMQQSPEMKKLLAVGR